MVELWSTAAEVRSKHGYCLFNVGHQSEHAGAVRAMDLFRADRTKAITGASDGCLKLWDIGAGDLCSLSTYVKAHAYSITGVSSSPVCPETFVTCSRDRSICMWDKRLSARPVIASFDGGQFDYTCVYWSTAAECAGQLLIGDEAGSIIVIDPRNINCRVHQLEQRESPIHKIQFNGAHLFAVLDHSARLQVLDAGGGDEFGKVVYSNGDAIDCVRSVHWTAPTVLYATGWDSKLRKHSF